MYSFIYSSSFTKVAREEKRQRRREREGRLCVSLAHRSGERPFGLVGVGGEEVR